MSGTIRHRVALVSGSVIVAGLCTGGWAAARSFETPAQAAARTAAPEPSRITVAAERRELSADLVARGVIRYDQPTAVRLAGAVGSDSSTSGAQKVTRLAERGTSVPSGATLAEVAGRPVFFLTGDQPTFRTIRPGASGDDVSQLEAVLAGLGFDPGPRDGVYDAAAQAAVAAFYESRGHQPQGMTDEEEDRVRELRKALLSAESALESAKLAEAKVRRGDKPASRADTLAAVRGAEADLAAALRKAAADRDDAAAAVSKARADLARAKEQVTDADAEVARTAEAQRQSDAALAAARAGGVNPTTGAPYTSEEIAVLTQQADSAATAARQAVRAQRDAASAHEAATSALNVATRTAASTPLDSAAAVQRAKDALESAKLRAGELADEPDGVTEAALATRSAQQQLSQARDGLARELADSGVSIPAGELVFLPAAAVRVQEVKAKPGDDAATELMTVTGSRLAVRASVSVADRDLIAVGSKAEIVAADSGIDTTGTVAEIAAEPGGEGVDDQHIRVLISLDDASAAGLADAADVPVRVTFPVRSTNGEKVLTVPVAALSLAADGTDRVEVEDAVDRPTRMVEVTTGISSAGVVQVEPVKAGALDEGDRVVIGTGKRSRGGS